MKIYSDYPFQVKREKRAIALGFFDGVHLGHQKLLDQLLDLSKENQYKATVFTFDNHPKSTINKSLSFPGLIQTPELRLCKLEEFGVEETIIAPVIQEVTRIPAETFYFKYLLEQFAAKVLIVGQDARFGYKGRGDVARLKEWSKKTNVELIVIPDVSFDHHKVSSSYIRQLIADGKIKLANQCLGYNYQIQGQVIHGKKLGRTLGFPTINMTHDNRLVKPRFGVYVSCVVYKNKSLPAITSIGINPTVDKDEKIKIETYIYNKDIDLYDEKVMIELLDFVRDEISFSSIQAMKERILKDLHEVEKIHKQNLFNTKP